LIQTIWQCLIWIKGWAARMHILANKDGSHDKDNGDGLCLAGFAYIFVIAHIRS